MGEGATLLTDFADFGSLTQELLLKDFRERA
jgi:hypothetical protein